MTQAKKTAKQQPGDAFATFLEQVKQAEPEASRPGGDAMSLLGVLAEQGGQSVPDLMQATSLGFERFAEALNAMLNAGLVQLTTKAGQEVVELTPSGAEIARLATPS
jgi:predicted transcriptional regulator